MSDMPAIRLYSRSLLSKWGFNDGDPPEAWLDWCDEEGIDWTTITGWRDRILPALVRRFLLPELEQDVKLTDISTCHNPIRAETVDGADVTGRWYDTSDSDPELTPECVEVPFREVLKIARESSPLTAGHPAPRTHPTPRR